MSHKCKNCQSTNPAEVSYCTQCGAELVESKKIHLSCTQCNYPLTDKHIHCPNCGVKKNKRNDDNRITRHLNSIRQTSNKAILKAISISGKTKSEDIELNRDHNIISRELIDNSDTSISISQHCSINYKNGSWFLQNHSSNKALFVQVDSPVELKDNVIILIGKEKFFIFKTE